ncbi:MAG: DUF1456 family protein [Spirochaetales bacterium]|nr:DUF1456 family protein [Spirochaetales bacterium]
MSITKGWHIELGFRRLRYALSINDKSMLDNFKETCYTIDFNTLFVYLKKEDDEGFIACPNAALEHFLDGLIIARRGRRSNTVERNKNISE